MTTIVDPTDVPVIEPRDLALALRLMLAGGRILTAAQNFSEDDIRRVEQALWQRLDKGAKVKVAVLLRLRSLLSICTNRRMQALLLRYGSRMVPHALAIAARMRLNTRWGFNPQRFVQELRSSLSSDPTLAMAA
jgi:diaminopimelate decarboxylase